MGFQRAFTVEGLNLERFVRQAGGAGIRLTSVRRFGGRRISAVCDEAVFPVLATLTEQGGWRFQAEGRTGFGHTVDRTRRRWLLVLALLMTVGLCMIGSQMVWGVQVTGAGAYEADIRAALTEMGVHVPMLRRQVDPGLIRDALEWRYPRVAWFECGWRGMTLHVRMVEGVQGDNGAAQDGPCDVIAVRDGVVKSIVTRAGTPVVGVGDVVRAGDVLIRGEERISGGAMRPVAARGSVYARVWDSAAVRTPLAVVETVYTGRTQDLRTVTSPWFPLWRLVESEFECEDISVSEQPLGGFFWPLVIRRETRLEADYRYAKTDAQSVVDENGRAALQKLYEITGGKESLVDIWVNWSIIEDEILLSVATGERVVDIAQQERSSGMAATE